MALDAEPVPGAEGYATAWSDGWLIINYHDGQRYIRHLGMTGAPELLVFIKEGDLIKALNIIRNLENNFKS